MADVLGELETFLQGVLEPADLNALRAALATFVAGNPDERAAAEAIASNLTDAVQAYLTGFLSKGDLGFVLENARKGYVALAEAKALRIQIAALENLFAAINGWLMKSS